MKLFHHEYGGEGDPQKPLTILHGLLGSLDNWHSLSRRLSEQYRVIALDQRNHGQSPHNDEMTYAAMAADLGEFLDDHHLSATALLGHSMGGKTAMEYSLRHPSRVPALLVVDIAPRSYPPHHEYIFDALFSLDLTSFESRTGIDRALAKQIPNAATRQFVMKNLKRNDDNSFRWKIHLEGLHKNMDELNSEIVSNTPYPGPALFIKGLKSDYIADQDTASIRRLFPNAVIKTLDTGHWVHAESPDEFYSLIVDFLRQSLYH
ncbi:MAG: alpha/beta fold hydrolase [Bacteroidota bacterium]